MEAESLSFSISLDVARLERQAFVDLLPFGMGTA
jgi:hypothetical protein